MRACCRNRSRQTERTGKARYGNMGKKGSSDMATVEEKYLKVYPGLAGKYMGALCDSADGVKL